MKYFIRKLFGLISIFGFLSGCASLRGGDYRDVYEPVEKRTGLQFEKPSLKKDHSEIISNLLVADLTIDNAIQVSLINNADLQALYQELGIAKADLLQASLFKNPRLEGHARIPNEDGNVNTEFLVIQDVMSILLMPLQRRVASSEFEEAKLRTSDAMISLLAEVKTAYYEAQAAERLKQMHATVLEAAEASAEFAERMSQAGNLNAPGLGLQRSALHEAQINYLESESDARLAREPLNRLLGLRDETAEKWKVKGDLSEPPPIDPDFEELSGIALENRLDYAAIKKHSQTLKRKLLAARLGIIPEAEAGFNTEREPDGDRVTGPMWAVEAPVFDWKQAESARTKAEIRQNRYKLSGFEVLILSEVRETYEKMNTSRLKAEKYKNDLIPIRHQLIEDLQKHYNYMLVGVFQLLEAKRETLEAEKEYVRTIKDYWVARAMLERAVGGKLPTVSVEMSVTKPVAEEKKQREGAGHHGGHHE